MRKIACAIVDDEPLAVRLLESFVARVDFLELKGSFTDSIEAVAAIRKEPVDLLFLDIQMPDMDGMGLARMLPSETKVVFTTAFKEYAFDSYDVAAIDFLLKPIRYDKFLRACEK
ncbi:MAG: response regulator, partial [Muribaculaceae bacterium]|nr:response regulator [Muribaculaceae bacterium]